jgi:hypothetical protein
MGQVGSFASPALAMEQGAYIYLTMEQVASNESSSILKIQK